MNNDELREALAMVTEERDRWKERWQGAVDDAQKQREALWELESTLTWGTTCLNCSSLLEQNYIDHVRAEVAEHQYGMLMEQVRNLIAKDFG